MKREYYFCGCRLDEKDWYFIWFSDEEDGLYLNAENKIAAFNDLESLARYAEKRNLLITDSELFFNNLEALEKTLGGKKFAVDCVEFLNAWNLFGDVSVSVNGDFNSDHKITYNIYEKLFWGNNLPAVTPEGEWYEPVWSVKELEIMRKVLLSGIALLRDNLNYTD